MKKKKYDFNYCMKNRCDSCKRSRECENQEKKGQKKVGEVNGK